jgi:nuclear transport factor 2 (NTF2) superfamily protein
MSDQRPPIPPYTLATAVEKVRKAEDGWNTRDPGHVALAYTTDSIWRNRAELLRGREAIEAFLTRKWNRELLERGFEVAVVKDATAGPRHPVWGDG